MDSVNVPENPKERTHRIIDTPMKQLPLASASTNQ